MTKRATTPTSRAACARHAVSELLNWEWPEDAGPDWYPTPQQVADKTTALYSWVTIDEAEAAEAINSVRDLRSDRRATRVEAATRIAVRANSGRTTTPKFVMGFAQDKFAFVLTETEAAEALAAFGAGAEAAA